MAGAARTKSARRGGPALSEAERAILQHYIEGIGENQVRITKKLDDPLYARIKVIFERLGGVYLPNQRRFEFPLDPFPMLRQTVALGQMPKENPLDFFYSPPGVVEALFNELEWGPAMLGLLAAYEQEGRPIRVIEPSAGLGHIADAFRVRYPMATIEVCEVDPYRRAVLASKGYTVVAEDFLCYHPPADHFYDLCLINPPFTLNGDTSAFLKHIRHAYAMLADHPLSKLVSVVPAQVARQKRYREFYIQVLQYGDYEDLPDGSFIEAGTTWQTGIISLGKRLNHFYAHWESADPDDNYPNQRIKRAWMYISADSTLVKAHRQIVDDMLEGKLPVYNSGKAGPKAKDAIEAFSREVTEQLLSDYKLYIPFTPDDLAFMERRILADYLLARKRYGEMKRKAWQLTQQRKRTTLLSRIEEAHQRIRRSREHIIEQERQLADDIRALDDLEHADGQVPDFAPALPLPDPEDRHEVHRCENVGAAFPSDKERSPVLPLHVPAHRAVPTQTEQKRRKEQEKPYIRHSLFDVPGI